MPLQEWASLVGSGLCRQPFALVHFKVEGKCSSLHGDLSPDSMQTIEQAALSSFTYIHSSVALESMHPTPNNEFSNHKSGWNRCDREEREEHTARSLRQLPDRRAQVMD